MIDIANILHFLAVVLAIGVVSICVGLSQGIISYAGLAAINIQPKAHHDITKAIFLGMALTETAAVLSMVIAITLLLGKNPTPHGDPFTLGIAEMGIGLAICLTGGIIGIISHLWRHSQPAHAQRPIPDFRQGTGKSLQGCRLLLSQHQMESAFYYWQL